jgi:4-hydroxy-2-oxoheptanedioate aldolase
VDGVDIVLFGPGDLSLDMGLQFGDRDGLMDAWLRVRDAAHAVSKLVMVPLGFGFEGADIVINGGDLQFLRQIATSMAARSPEFMKSYG